MKQSILISGADGMIGTYLLNYFTGKYSVNTTSFYNPDNKYLFSGDLTSLDFTNELANKCKRSDILIFLVGLAHAKGQGKDLPDFKNVNFQALVNLLLALGRYNKLPEKIIFASSISVYGEKYNQNAYDEESEKHPFSPYAVTKLEAEHYLLENYADKSWILRFAPVYSPDFQLNINRRTQSGNWFYKVGNGSKKLSLCNLENIGSTVQGILEDKVPSGVYNISDAKEYTYNDLLTWNNAGRVIRIPQFAVRLLYYLGKIINNTFLKENTVKLISDNIFPSDKIRSYVDLSATINDINFSNDY